MKIKCIILTLSFIAAAFLQAQEFSIPPNVDGINQYLGLKVWGWSETGKVALSYNDNVLLSYGEYGPNCSVNFIIFDMVDDAAVFSEKVSISELKNYSEYKDGVERVTEVTINECYVLMNQKIANAIKEHHIVASHQTELLQFPFIKDNRTYDLLIDTTGLDEFFDSASTETFHNIKTMLTMTSGDKSKIVTSAPIRGGAAVLGYISSPIENRVLIVLANALAGYNETELEITGFTGCHLDVGFQ